MNQHEHEESNQFRFGEKNYIPTRDLKSPVFEFELRHDSFGIAYQLHGDHVCKVWERFLLIWSSFGCFPLYLSCHPSLPGCGSGFQEEVRRGGGGDQGAGAHQAAMEEATATTKTLNANGACRRGKLLWFPEQAVAAKMVVAVDVDEGIVKR